MRALEPLLEACNHANPVVRFRAVWVLGYTHDSRAYETILRLTDDPDEGVRYDATIALGVLGDTRAIEPLTRYYLNNDGTRPAGMAFARMGLDVVPTLEEILRQGNGDVRWSVTQVLGNFVEKYRDEHCLELLKECRNDPDTSVSENAAFWIKEIHGNSTQTG